MAAYIRKKMTEKYKFNFVVSLLILLGLCCTKIESCIMNSYNITTLDRASPWIAMNDAGNVTFKISLCKALAPNGNSGKNCPANSAVCMIQGDTAVSIGNFTDGGLKGTENDEGETYIFVAGSTCPEQPDENLTTSIIMKCGRTMGSPVYLEYNFCVHYFEWESNVFCKDTPLPIKEVKCYVHDIAGEKYDLTPLMKTKGGYLVDDDEDRTFYINVCRDINHDPLNSEISQCPPGSSVCRVKDNKADDMGQSGSDLKLSAGGHPSLTYTTDKTVDGCTSPPTTHITFICPEHGAKTGPRLINDFNCQNTIEWHTEHACKQSVLTNNSCILTAPDRNIDIDLTPLKKPGGSTNPYKVRYTDSRNVTYDYFLNVCGGLEIPCPDDNHKIDVTVCQTEPDNSAFGAILGRLDHQTLRYADGELTLTYKRGTYCHHNKFQRTTIINFHCNKTAGNGGKGWPVFVEEKDCTYVFDWNTSYACVEPSQSACNVLHKDKRFDLSPLTKRTGDNWEILHDAHGDDSSGNETYYVNVCNDLLVGNKATGCSSDSSLCLKVAGASKPLNLGRYSSDPVYNPVTKTLTMNYTDGDQCGDSGTGRIYSVLTFTCRPGALESGPVLVRRSSDGCIYEFEWPTAAACVLKHVKGSNCQVFDEDAGIKFDLSSLKMNTGGGYRVNDTDHQYEYILNICTELRGTECDSLKNATIHPGVCQVKKGTNDAWITGQFTDSLSYYNGLINLTYANGSPYHSGHLRKTEIAFLCDDKVGKGQPKFVEESNHTYSFEWYTSYACPTAPMECSFVDPRTNKQYDLSSLSHSSLQTNWEIGVDSDHNSIHKYYINICRTLNPVRVGDGCDPRAAICRTKIQAGNETVDVRNLGELRSGPTVSADGHLSLNYLGPKDCVVNGEKRPYNVTFHFVCKDKSLRVDMLPQRKDDPCTFDFLWDTSTACLLEEGEQLGQCLARDKNSGFIFNLHPLMKKGTQDPYYTVNGSNKETFRLNICGNVSCGSQDKVAVCNVSNGAQEALAYNSNTTLDYNDDGRMTMIYDGVRLSYGQRVKVEIVFRCRVGMDLGEPKFVRKEEYVYMFDFETSLACPPQPVDCSLTDKEGNRYELDALKKQTYWEVTDTRSGHSNLKYYINVCGPIDTTNDVCPGGGTLGACQVATGDKSESYHLGYIQSRPMVKEKGVLTIHYRSGDLCHKGTDKESYRSTTINLYCSQVSGVPVFQGETETCEYIFNWYTSAACPVGPKTVGSNCKVIDPLYNYEYDLTPLKNAAADYRVRGGDHDEYLFLLTVCGPLHNASACSGGQGNGGCQSKPQDKNFVPINIGNANGNLTYDDGLLSLTYMGGKANCHQKFERKTIIQFHCDPRASSSSPTYVKESDSCEYVFDWYTKYACPPAKVAQCALDVTSGEKVKHYDLSDLTSLTENYALLLPREKKKIIFNICRSLAHKQYETCPHNAAVCMIDESTNATKKYISLGEVSEDQMQMENGRLMLVYKNGDLCGNSSTERLSSHILFYCSQNPGPGKPTGHFTVGEHKCDHHFIWETHAACAVESGTPTPAPGTGTGGSAGGNGTQPKQDCTIISPKTGNPISLQALKGNVYNADDGAGHIFKLSVCGPLSHKECSNADSGACQVEQTGQHRTINAGIFNSNLHYNDGIVYLNYTSGERCHNNKYERNVIINFVCSHGTGNGKPVFMNEDDECTYQFSWLTSLVCEEQIKCTVDINNIYTLDLSPLGAGADHLVTNSLGNIYYLSVCRPLLPMIGFNGPPGASVWEKNSSDPRSVKSLGKQMEPPVYNPSNNFLTLTYKNGSQCDVDPTATFYSTIMFSCNKDRADGEPVFVRKSRCMYLFNWETSLACPPTKEQQSQKQCAFVDSTSGTSYDLKELMQNVGDTYKVPAPDGGQYLLNVCDSVGGSCGNAMVCLDNGKTQVSYGKAEKYVMDKEGSMLKLLYGPGDICKNKMHSQSHILFECDPSVPDKGQPVIFETSEEYCYVVFLWKTSLVCPPVDNECTLRNGNNIYDLNLLSRDHNSWNLTDTNGNWYWINVCQAVHNGPGPGCNRTAGACRQTKDGQVDPLGDITTQRLYMDADGETIILEYSHGAVACSSGARRSNNVAAKTRIKFKCTENTVGGPVFVPQPDNDACIFEFEWQTRLACKLGSKRIEVQAKNGVIIDPRSQGQFDLKPLYGIHNMRVNDELIFDLNLNSSIVNCQGAYVCKRDGRDGQNNIGMNMKYYMHDDILDIELTSNQKCPEHDKMYITSTITFHCNHGAGLGEPQYFRDPGNKCAYLFLWETNVTCPNLVIVNPQPLQPGVNSASAGTQSGSQGHGAKSSTVAAIVSVFVAAIVICVLLVIFHKADRRAACMGKVRSVFSRKQSEYTQLPSDAVDEIATNDIMDDVMVINNAADSKSNETTTYHDYSDEELLA